MTTLTLLALLGCQTSARETWGDGYTKSQFDLEERLEALEADLAAEREAREALAGTVGDHATRLQLIEGDHATATDVDQAVADLQGQLDGHADRLDDIERDGALASDVALLIAEDESLRDELSDVWEALDTAARLPVIRSLSGRAWLQPGIVQPAANYSYTAGALEVGGPFLAAAEPTYLRLPLVAPAVLDPAQPLSVRLEWVLECLTDDCDPKFVLAQTDGARAVEVWAMDNSNGTVYTGSVGGDGNTTPTIDLGGNVRRMTVDFSLLPTELTTLTWAAEVETGATVRRSWESSVSLDPSAGLELAAQWGGGSATAGTTDVGEHFRLRLLRIEVRSQ